MQRNKYKIINTFITIHSKGYRNTFKPFKNFVGAYTNIYLKQFSDIHYKYATYTVNNTGHIVPQYQDDLQKKKQQKIICFCGVCFNKTK